MIVEEDTMNYPESKLDEYARQTLIQNGGGTCEHCGSTLGHLGTCPLINREAAESFYRPQRLINADPLANTDTTEAALWELWGKA